MPLFAAVEKQKKMKIAKYVLLVGGVCNILIPFVNSVFQLGITWPYQITVVLQNMFWVWVGYYFYNKELSTKQKTLVYALALAGLLTILIGTYSLSMKAGSIQNLFKGNNNLPCVLYAIGVLVFLKDLGTVLEKQKPLRKIISILGRYTFAAYLLHWFALMILDDVFKVNLRSITYRLFSPYLIYATVIVFTFFVRKIPILRKMLP